MWEMSPTLLVNLLYYLFISHMELIGKTSLKCSYSLTHQFSLLEETPTQILKDVCMYKEIPCRIEHEKLGGKELCVIWELVK